MYNGKVTFKRENKSVFKFRRLPGIKELKLEKITQFVNEHLNLELNEI